MRIHLVRNARVLFCCALALVMTVLPVAAAGPSVSRITPQYGFGDPNNSYSWGMAWFNGKLYVGTSRQTWCVELETENYYFPGQGYYNLHPDPSVTCPADPYDLSLQAEIWAYDPTNANQPWTRVYQAPAIPNPAESGKTIGRDIAYRDMAVVTINGTPTLVVAGVTAGEYIHNADFTPSLPPPRLLLTTDGVHFSEADYTGPVAANWVTGPAPSLTPVAHPYPMGFRGIQQLPDGRIFVTATVSLTGDGVVAQFDPVHNTFSQVGPPTLRAYEIEPFNGYLYVGTADPAGYSVYKTTAANPDSNGYFSYTPVVTGGGGRGSSMLSVVSMHVFQNRLYVGSSGWYNGASTELIRINPDDSWDVVVGAPVTVGGVTKQPISGYLDGFNNFFNVHFWRMEDVNGALFVGTNDSSWLFRTVSWLDPLLSWQYGYDVYATCDGQFWFPITWNAFGEGLYNFGARTMAKDPSGNGYIGSANHAQGTGVWQGTGISFCGQPSAATAAMATTLVSQTASSSMPMSFGPLALAPQSPSQAPQHVQADLQACGATVTWDPVPGASQYQVYRSTYTLTPTSAQRPNAHALPKTSSTLTLGSLVSPLTEVPANTPIQGPLVQVGTTSQPYFVDAAARPGGQYAYQVQAVDGKGVVSPPSNLAPVPSQAPKADYAQLVKAVSILIGQGKIGGQAGSLLGILAQAQQAAARGDTAGALRSLAAIQALIANGRGGIDPIAASDIAGALASLSHQAAVAQVSCPQR